MSEVAVAVAAGAGVEEVESLLPLFVLLLDSVFAAPPPFLDEE